MFISELILSSRAISFGTGKMGLLRGRDERLPVYERVSSPTKERCSNDDYDYDYSSDDDYERYPSTNQSARSSRNTSGSLASGVPMLPKRQPATKRVASVYPYRLPTKVTRYLCIGIFVTLILMILSLVRASQVENWKVANGKTETRPAPPPLWERFPLIERYYGGLRTLMPFEESKPDYPPTDDSMSTRGSGATPRDTQPQDGSIESQPWNEYGGRVKEEGIKECFIDAAGTVRVPEVHYYNGRPLGFPRNVIGSYEVLNLPEDICFERFGRYGPYGFGYSLKSGGLGTGENGEKNGSDAVWAATPRVDFRGIDWAEVQSRCYSANSARFHPLPPKPVRSNGFYIGGDDSVLNDKVAVSKRADVEETAEVAGEISEKEPTSSPSKSTKPATSTIEKKSRTAVVIRCYDEYLFREDDIAAIRSMIAELALASGGRYDIHLLIQVRNDAAFPIWADQEAYEARIRDTIPEEFRGLVTLWTETQMLSLYQGIYDLYSRGPDLPVHGVYRGLSMAMQYFAYMHPEYEFFWQWEMDVRYTGHYYDFFTKIEEWSKAQPRKGQWERSARFYFPDTHGTWEDFAQMARVQSEMGVVGADNIWKGAPGLNDEPEKPKGRKTIWGPQRPLDDDDWFQPANDPVPPSGGPEKDHYEWGVGEEADYISLNPIFDPDGTTWLLKDDITGFNRSAGALPRRANIITTSRMSRRLLLTMHKMTAYKKQFAFPEMWPATVALQHGYKAVFAPHPLYVDRKWPIDFMAQKFNGGRDGSSGGARTSIFGEGEHNMKGMSWFYNSGFAPNLYKRWLGLKVNNDGGDEFEMTRDESKQGGSVGDMPGGEGRMCLPPMLLHPVKEVELPVEAPPEEGESIPVSDPAS
jgi:hypothetical protein